MLSLTPTESWTLVCWMVLVAYLGGIILLRAIINPDEDDEQ